MSDTGKPTRKHRSKQAIANVQRATAHAAKNIRGTTLQKSSKLSRQLNGLIQKEANWEKVTQKADAIEKARWREARVNDFGRKASFKPRVARRQLLVSTC